MVAMEVGMIGPGTTLLIREVSTDKRITNTLPRMEFATQILTISFLSTKVTPIWEATLILTQSD